MAAASPMDHCIHCRRAGGHRFSCSGCGGTIRGHCCSREECKHAAKLSHVPECRVRTPEEVATQHASTSQLQAELAEVWLPRVTRRSRTDVQDKLNLGAIGFVGGGGWRWPIGIQRANEFALLGLSLESVDHPAADAGITEMVWHGKRGDKTDSGWARVRITSEAQLHFDPAPHADLMFASVVLPPWEAGRAKGYSDRPRLGELGEISQTLAYDAKRRELSAGCHFMGAAIATLYLARRFLQEEISSRRAQAEYGRTIARLADELKAAEARGTPVAELPAELPETGALERFVLGPEGQNVFGATLEQARAFAKR